MSPLEAGLDACYALEAAGETLTVARVRTHAKISQDAASKALSQFRTEKADTPTIPPTAERLLLRVWREALALASADYASSKADLQKETADAWEQVESEKRKAEALQAKLDAALDEVESFKKTAADEIVDLREEAKAERERLTSEVEKAKMEAAELRGQVIALQQQAKQLWNSGKTGKA